MMRIVCVAAWLVGVSATSGTAQLSMDTLSLYQLPGVLVVVSPLPPEAAADGLDGDDLRRVMEDKIGDAGIRIFSEDEWQVTFGNPLVYMAVTLVRPSEHFYLYHLELEVRQLASLTRDSTPVYVPTWRSGSTLGTVPSNRLSVVRQAAIDATDRFLSAHAAANRRRIPSWWN